MINKGLFSSIFIEDLKERVTLDDAANGRMATLTQTWNVRNARDTESLWETFIKKALGYLEFVPSGGPVAPGVYPLYEDFSFSACISILYLARPGSDIDDVSVGRFFPAKLLAHLKDRKLTWGILTDGSRWRLYSNKSSRPYEDYVELSLAETLEGSDEAEYSLFERFFHRDSFIARDAEDTSETGRDESAGIYKCRLDHDRNQSEQALEQYVKAPFLAQVDEVLQYICNGFIFDTQKSGEEYTEVERAEIFESAVKLIYRCLFLFYAEARRLLPTEPEKAELYHRHSIQTLCLEARKFRWGQRRDTDQYDLWKHLKGLINAVNDGDPEYGIMGYNGGLFDDQEERFLGRHQLRNDFLSRALYLLAFVEPLDNEHDSEYPMPYEDLEVRHLGELYENILEYTVMLADADRIRRRTKKGVEILLATQTTKKTGDTLIKKGDVYFGESALERKQTGSYYTPESLVRFLNQKSIIQPLYEAFERNYRKRFNDLLEQVKNGHDTGTRRGATQSAAALVERFAEEEVFQFKVCDPAMGSGHFLVDAANQMTGLVIALLAEVSYVEGMTVSVTSHPNDWRRRITRHCIYGVDLNPLAVNLAKLSLWLNCFATHHRLTFLDHHVRCGNSLIGIRSLSQLATIPERKRDGKKKKDDMTGSLFPDFQEYAAMVDEAGQDIQSISAMDEDETDAQKAAFDRAQEKVSALNPLADLCTSYLMDAGIRPEDYNTLFYSIVRQQPIQDPLNPDLPKILEAMENYQNHHHFFHWPLEFPDVFPDENSSFSIHLSSFRSGFSATVGNPPWDIVKPNSQEFFSDYDPKFRSYNKQEANRVSKKLMVDNPVVAENWNQYCDGIAEQSAYFKEPLSYSALGKGDINTFKLFIEQFFSVLGDGGRMGIVVPSGIYTDQGCQPLRQLFFSQSRIEFIYCFENRWPTVFSAVDGRFKFVTFGTQKGEKTDRFKCAFMEHDPERLPVIDANALKMSVKQVRKFSPDSISVMELKSQRDVEIMTSIYGDIPLLGQNVEESWNVKLRMGDYHLTNDSFKFNRIDTLLGSMPASAEELIMKLLEHTNYPVYEGKNCWFYDSNVSLPTLCVEKKHTDGIAFSLPRVGFRRIAASTNERSLIPCIVPKNSLCTYGIIFADDNATVPLTIRERIFYAGIIGSFSLDFILRFQISTSISNSNGYSLPILRTHAGAKEFEALVSRVSRLIAGTGEFSDLWNSVFDSKWQSPDFWYHSSAPIDIYGPVHEQEIRRRLRDDAKILTPEWGPHCGVHDRLTDRRDTGDRAQLRAEIDAYVAHLYGLSRDDFAYILDTFPVLKKKEKKAFGEFMSKRKCLEEYDRIGKIMNAE
jgi:hypothetical protein